MAIETQTDQLNFDRRKFTVNEKPIEKARRMETISAGNFLQRSGLMDAVIQYSNQFPASIRGMHGEIESVAENNDPLKEVDKNLFNDFSANGRAFEAARASIVLEWTGQVDPTDVYILRISALKNTYKDGFLSASLKKTHGQKNESYYVRRIFLGKGFNFDNPIQRKDKRRFRRLFNKLIEMVDST